MAKEQRSPFQGYGHGYVATRKFKFHGQTYNVGDDFPYKTISCSKRKLQLLYEGRYIGPQTEESSETETAPPETKEVEKDVEEEKTKAPEKEIKTKAPVKEVSKKSASKK